MWGWLLLTLPLALLLLLLLLALPADLVLDATFDDRGARGRARLEWSLLRKDLEPGGRGPGTPKERKRPNLLAMLQTEGFADAVWRAARRLRRSTRVRAVDARLTLGLGDPAATGQAMGVLAPLSVLVPLPRTARIRLEPDFDRERLEGDVHARVRIWPLLALGAVVLFALTPGTIRALRAGRRG